MSRFPNRFSSGDGHPCYHHRLGYNFSVFFHSLLLLAILLCLSLCFISPPRRPYARIFLSFVLLRPCSNLSLSTYPFILPGINSSLSDLLASFLTCFISDLFSSFCSDFLVLLVLLCSRTRCAGICFTHEFTIIVFAFGLSLSQSVTT